MQCKAIMSVNFLEDGDPDAKIQAWLVKNEDGMPCRRGVGDDYFASKWRTLSQDTRNMMWERARKICKLYAKHPASFIETLNVMLQDATINVYTPAPVTHLTLAQKRKALRNETNMNVLTQLIVDGQSHASLRKTAISKLGETLRGVEWLINYTRADESNYSELRDISDSVLAWWQKDATRLAKILTAHREKAETLFHVIGNVVGRLPPDSADALLDVLTRKHRHALFVTLKRNAKNKLISYMNRSFPCSTEDEMQNYVAAINRMFVRHSKKRRTDGAIHTPQTSEGPAAQ